jgi:hypothetical protein
MDGDALRENTASLNWDRYFIKDYIKSNTANGRDSIAKSVDEAMELVALLETYRGEVASRKTSPIVCHYR